MRFAPTKSLREKILGLQEELRAALSEYQQSQSVGQLGEGPGQPLVAEVPPSPDLAFPADHHRQWWHALSHQAELCLAIFDINLTYLEASTAWQQAFELPEGWQGRSHFEVHPEQVEQWEAIHHQILVGTSLRQEGILLKPNGEAGRWHQWHIFPWYQGEMVAGAIACAIERPSTWQATSRARKLKPSLDLAADVADLGIARWNYPEGVISLNEQLAQWLDQPVQQALPLEVFYQHIHPEDHEDFAFYWRQPWQENRFLEREYRLIGAGGRVYHCLEKIDFERDGQGKIVQAISAIHDISRLRETEASLEESELRFQGIFHQMFQFIGLLDPSGIVIEANETALQFGGLSSEEVIGRPFWEARWWQKDAATVADLKAAIQRAAQGELVRYEVEVLGIEDRMAAIDFSLKPVLNECGKVVLIIPEGRDITERREAERKLAAAQYMFEQFMTHTPALAWIKDEQLRFRYVNAPFERVLKVDKAWVIGKTDYDLLAPEQVPSIQANDQRVLDTGENITVIEHAPQEDGTLNYVLAYKFPVALQDGEKAVAGVAIDITDRVLAEEKLKKLNKALEERAEARGRQVRATEAELAKLAYSIAHDLRAPLRHISAYTDMVLEEEGDRLSEEGRQSMKNVLFSAERMGTLIDELLRYARSDRQELTYAPVNLNELVNEVIALIAPQDLAIDWQVATLPTISADRPMVQQVFQNVLENAVKFSRKQAKPRIEIGWEQDADHFTIFVKDNGVGFNPAYQAKLFRLFQRLHSAKEFEGTGMGLANVQRIIERHGGTVRAVGEQSKGATFFLSLPQSLLV